MIFIILFKICFLIYNDKQKTEESISKLVDGIIDAQVNDNQFINTDLTFRDITTIKKVFKKKLMNIYHVRIAYPV